MRTKAFLPIFLLLVVVLATGAYGAGQEKGKTSPKGQPVIIEEDVWLIFADEPEKHFTSAHENFLKKDTKAAAIDIRKASAFMKAEASRASAKTKADLLASSKELDSLADRVEKGAVTSNKELEDAFAKAHYSLSKHHKERAEKHLLNKEYKKASAELKDAAMYYERGIEWSGQKIETKTTAVLNDTRALADKMREKAGIATEEASKGIANLSKEIEEWGQRIMPPKKTSPANK